MKTGRIAANDHSASRVDLWDVIVIGTGLGGATVGHRLTQDGRRVLFLEKGIANFADPNGTDIMAVEHPKGRLKHALWPDRVATSVDGRESGFFAPLGCGADGSSQLFAATLERFERHDIESIDDLPHPTGGWPFLWNDLEKYYAQAERLYAIKGTIDPLARGPRGEPTTNNLMLPVPPSLVDAQLMRDLEARGLHPYRLHVGFAYRPDCRECGGKPCPRRCKSDAAYICLEPALHDGQGELRTKCDVMHIEAGPRKVRAVHYRDRDGILRSAQRRVVILAAGAYRSPALLLRSKSPQWPTGLANHNDRVGRHLMFHVNEWFAVWPTRRASHKGPRKTIGLRDLYNIQGKRLGSIQSTGLAASDHNIYRFLIDTIERSGWSSWLRPYPLLTISAKIVAKIAAKVFGKATVLVMLVEDIGYPDNRIVLDENAPDLIRVVYSVKQELKERSRLARMAIRRAFTSLRTFPLHADLQLNFGHPCGTCRAGDDPQTSVIDGTCKEHELDNLYVFDASFIPTSAGTNPGLTIIANALRVGDLISARLRESRAVPFGAAS